HVGAFARRHAASWIVAVAPRLVTALTAPGRMPHGRDAWGETLLKLPADAPGRWRNVLTGEALTAAGGPPTLRLSEVLSRLPVALLSSEVAS
ncbi:MAG: hypothetical protein IIC89_05940, partial [Chloroflexi bacterium]|nr:hypothetical protein [Chloroflexota bacterium]